MACVPACLPYPALLPNLRCLSVGCLEWDEHWLGALAQLPQLAELQLGLAPPARQPPATGQHMALPALPALKRLAAFIEPGCPPLRLDLSRLPALEVRGGRDRRAAMGEGRDRRLRCLCAGAGTRCLTVPLLHVAPPLLRSWTCGAARGRGSRTAALSSWWALGPPASAA